jgi:hypothetical protein
MRSLEKELEEEFRNSIKIAQKNGFTPITIIRMIDEHGGLETAKRQLVSDSYHSGLADMLIAGLKDYTIEAIVLKNKFRPLFSDAELDIARKRLG